VRQVAVTLVDDLDGQSEAHETVEFGYRGKSYEIDLSEDHANELDKLLGPYLEAARRTAQRRGTSGRDGRAPRRTSGGKSTAMVREWARAQGIEISDRGRIPATVQERYDQENRPG
jgi:hypothetical protein